MCTQVCAPEVVWTPALRLALVQLLRREVQLLDRERACGLQPAVVWNDSAWDPPWHAMTGLVKVVYRFPILSKVHIHYIFIYSTYIMRSLKNAICGYSMLSNDWLSHRKCAIIAVCIACRI
jgi:hypothetical protein